jgi:glycosyltransferase involved in cell wall biosynthesis
MKVLFLIPEYNVSGGIGTFYRGLLPVLRASGLEISVLEGSAFHFAEGTKRVIDGINFQLLEQKRFYSFWNRFSSFEAAPTFRRHLAAAWALWEQAEFGASADIIEATDWGLLFIPPAIERSRPLVVQCHGSIGQIADHDAIETEAIDEALARLIECSVLSTVSTLQTYAYANANFWQTETTRDVSVIRPAWAPRGSPNGDGPSNRGLVIGRLQRWKGPTVLCEALQRIANREFGIEWVGRETAWGVRGFSTGKYLAQTYPNLWGKRFVHQLPIPYSEVARKQASALCNIIPSTWDTFNFTAVEAMASGRPAIVSKGAGASELIENGVNGYLFDAEDADSLACAIDRVLGETPTRLAEVGEEGKKTIGTALDPQLIASQRIAGYRASIDKFQSSSSSSVEGWLGSVCRPDQTTGAGMRFLENVPLRVLAKHVAERLVRRIKANSTHMFGSSRLLR